MELNGSFNIESLGEVVLPGSELEAYWVDRETGDETFLSDNEGFYAYQFKLGEKKHIKIVNKSGSHQFNKNEKEELEFPATAGRFTVYLHDSEAGKDKIRKSCTFAIVDYLGRNLLSREYNYLIANLSVNNIKIPENLWMNKEGDKLRIRINPLIKNYVSFSWINTQGLWVLEEFILFSGNQILTIK